MSGLFGHTLLLRLFALGILLLCWMLLSRSGTPGLKPSAATLALQQPTLTAEVQPDAPLVISSISSNGDIGAEIPFVEFGFYIVNVSTKPIRAYAIRQQISDGGQGEGGGVALYNPQLSNELLRPGQSSFIPSTANVKPNKKVTIVLSVDFVEFADGTKWGADSVRSSESAAGQRAGAYAITQRLLSLLNSGRLSDVVQEIDSGSSVESPSSESEAWSRGFRAGRGAVLEQLKRTKREKGAKELDRDLRRYAETLKENK